MLLLLLLRSENIPPVDFAVSHSAVVLVGHFFSLWAVPLRFISCPHPQIYHGQHLDQGIVARVPCPKLGSFSLAPGAAPYRRESQPRLDYCQELDGSWYPLQNAKASALRRGYVPDVLLAVP